MTQANTLGKFIISPDRYTSLSLSNKRLTDADCIKLATSLKDNESLTELNLSDNMIGDAGVEAIADALKDNKSLTSLNLGNTGRNGRANNKIGDAGATAIADALIHNKSLTTLSLRSNKIEAAGATAIADALIHNKSLTMLELDSNKIEAAGATAIADALIHNKSLTTLSLRSNKIEAAGATAIANALKKNKSLSWLSLGSNQIGDAGAIAIADALKENKSLTSLSIGNNNIGNAGAIAIADALIHNESVIKLGLFLNNIGNRVLEDIADALKDNENLTKFKLHNNKIRDSRVTTIANKLKDNKSLTPLKLNIKQIEDKRIKPKEKLTQVKSHNIFDQEISSELTNIFDVEENILHINASEEILQINELIKEGNDRLQGENQQGILLIGKTGSGKSTLAHLLTGKELQAIHDDETFALIIDALQPLQEIAISHNKTSETKIPNKCQIKDLVIWDCPGFKDTDPAQEIANAFYIKKLSETTKQLKFILVVSDSEIMDNRGTSFVETVSQMVKSFNDIEELSKSVSLVVTRGSHGKQAQHIINSINRVLADNKNIEPATKQMIEYLKSSIQVFNTPLSEGKIIAQTDMLAAINNSTQYYNSNGKLANMSISKEAIAYSNNLLQIVSGNFNKLLETIVSALSDPAECITVSVNNILLNKHELVKSWVPSSIKYSAIENTKSSDYFIKFDQLRELQDAFNKKDSINSFEEGLAIFEQVLQLFSKYVSQESVDLHKTIQEYIYVFKQQFEYIKFFSTVCGKGLPNTQGFNKIIEKCYSIVSSNLREQIEQIELDDNITDIAYYNKAIKYLDLYPDSPICLRNKAKVYIKLGDLAEQENNSIKELEYYIEAIKCDSKQADIYDKLGNLFYNEGKYSQAIECYKVINNAFEIRNCYKKWIAENPKDPNIIMQRGDYCTSAGLYEEAKKSYHNAFSLSKSSEIKDKALTKIADILENSVELASHYREMVTQHEYCNFDMVDDNFVDLLLGQNVETPGY